MLLRLLLFVGRVARLQIFFRGARDMPVLNAQQQQLTTATQTTLIAEVYKLSTKLGLSSAETISLIDHSSNTISNLRACYETDRIDAKIYSSLLTTLESGLRKAVDESPHHLAPTPSPSLMEKLSQMSAIPMRAAPQHNVRLALLRHTLEHLAGSDRTMVGPPDAAMPALISRQLFQLNPSRWIQARESLITGTPLSSLPGGVSFAVPAGWTPLTQPLTDSFDAAVKSSFLPPGATYDYTRRGFQDSTGNITSAIITSPAAAEILSALSTEPHDVHHVMVNGKQDAELMKLVSIALQDCSKAGPMLATLQIIRDPNEPKVPVLVEQVENGTVTFKYPAQPPANATGWTPSNTSPGTFTMPFADFKGAIVTVVAPTAGILPKAPSALLPAAGSTAPSLILGAQQHSSDPDSSLQAARQALLANPAKGDPAVKSELDRAHALLREVLKDPKSRERFLAISKKAGPLPQHLDKDGLSVSSHLARIAYAFRNEPKTQAHLMLKFLERFQTYGVTTQDRSSTCAAETFLRYVNITKPGEWARIAADLMIRWESSLKGGVKWTGDKDNKRAEPDPANPIRLRPANDVDKPDGSPSRDYFDAIMQSAIMGIATERGFSHYSANYSNKLCEFRGSYSSVNKGMCATDSAAMYTALDPENPKDVQCYFQHAQKERAKNRNQLAKFLLSEVSKENPADISLFWVKTRGGENDSQHAVLFLGLDTKTNLFLFSNPHGTTFDAAGNQYNDGDWIDDDGPRRWVIDNRTGLQGMTRDDFDRHLANVIIPRTHGDKISVAHEAPRTWPEFFRQNWIKASAWALFGAAGADYSGFISPIGANGETFTSTGVKMVGKWVSSSAPKALEAISNQLDKASDWIEGGTPGKATKRSDPTPPSPASPDTPPSAATTPGPAATPPAEPEPAPQQAKPADPLSKARALHRAICKQLEIKPGGDVASLDGFNEEMLKVLRLLQRLPDRTPDENALKNALFQFSDGSIKRAVALDTLFNGNFSAASLARGAVEVSGLSDEVILKAKLPFTTQEKEAFKAVSSTIFGPKAENLLGYALIKERALLRSAGATAPPIEAGSVEAIINTLERFRLAEIKAGIDSQLIKDREDSIKAWRSSPQKAINELLESDANP